ncbi:hypothetical protein [Achromobacter anxifer]|uniref:hypothetical protein n=1 Tax=Achromobacter anxifer TaxID=1287737 RepID=UPI00215864CB|nr:hypothetical protein [Achromobacter anxifer]
MKPSRLLLLFLGAALVAPASAHVDVTPKLAVVQGKPASVYIVNRGDRAEYVSIALSRLLNPGVETEQERLEPVAQTEQPVLYVSPFKLSLAPGQSKTITLKPLADVEQEQVYRLISSRSSTCWIAEALAPPAMSSSAWPSAPWCACCRNVKPRH